MDLKEGYFWDQVFRYENGTITSIKSKYLSMGAVEFRQREM